MRVTNGMLVNTTLTGLYNNMNAMNKTYAQMVSGKKIQTVSDDPIIAGRALKLKTSVLENEQYESNTKEATSWMEMTEGALSNIHDILQTIRTKCVEAATGTLENKDKEIIKNEIEELWKQIQEEGNVSYGGRYVFTGYKTSEPLVLTTDTTLKEECTLEADLYLPEKVTIGGEIFEKGTTLPTGTILLTGTVLPAGTLNPAVNGKITDQSIQYEIGVNSTISVNTQKMDEIFSGISQAIGDLSSKIEASLKDDTITTEQLYQVFNDKLKDFDSLLGDVSKATTDLGARMARVDYVESRLTDQKTTLKSLLSDTEDIDIEEVYVKFNTQYATYQSALQATSKIITNTLADYL